MRNSLLTFLVAFLSFTATVSAQIVEPVTWTTQVKKTGNATYDLIMEASIEEGWYLYTQSIPDGGPIPTLFTFENAGDGYKLVGDVVESPSKKKFDKIFEMDLSYFAYHATFTQKIEVTDSNYSSINAMVDFQSCDDAKCIFESSEFTFQLQEKKAEDSKILQPVNWEATIKKIGEDTYELVFDATIEKGWHVYSIDPYDDSDPTVIGPIATSFMMEDTPGVESVGSLQELSAPINKFDKVFEMDVAYFDNQASFSQKLKVTDPSIKKITASIDFQTCDDEKCIYDSKEITFDVPAASAKIEEASLTRGNDKTKDTRGMWTIFFVAFGAGLLALLTPCMFPMIPLTVSFFTKQSKTKATGIRNAIIYGLSIIIIYVFLGTIVTLIFGSEALSEISTSVTFNILFFVILVVFAISFLGAFEITLPQSWANKVDSKADKGGLLGIFFMALALAIVSFSCTGPLVGGILFEAASNGGLAPVIGMLGFSSAIAIPFALFAMFPGWLNSLPKSGGWLNTVKVVLGFLELAFAFKFLSQADLVLQLHWLEREVFIAIWIAVFGALTLYLFGKIKLPHDSPLSHISVGRLLLGLLTLTFTIYMLPGLWGAPLNLISAFPPSQEYSESPYGVGYSKTGGGSASADHSDLPDGGHLLAPHDILAFNDYDKGLAYAKEVNKPVMIDFTGWACVNCRKMEQNVWPKGAILPILKNEVVLISLYVDDKRELPEKEKFISPTTGKKVKTIGNKWSDFQVSRYRANAQPLYVLMNHDGENLIDPVGYTPDVSEYEAWLKKGIGNFKK